MWVIGNEGKGRCSDAFTGALMPSFCSQWCDDAYGPKNHKISVFQVSVRVVYGLKGRAISKGSMIEGGLRAVSSWMFMEVGGVHFQRWDLVTQLIVL